MDEQDVNINSEDFKAGYRQGYIDGMNDTADKVLDMMKEIERKQKQSTDDGK